MAELKNHSAPAMREMLNVEPDAVLVGAVCPLATEAVDFVLPVRNPSSAPA